MFNDFIVQYDKAITGRRRAKEDEDFHNKFHGYTNNYAPIEKQVGELLYTKTITVLEGVHK